jgi:uncharacterized membrane protein
VRLSEVKKYPHFYPLHQLISSRIIIITIILFYFFFEKMEEKYTAQMKAAKAAQVRTEAAKQAQLRTLCSDSRYLFISVYAWCISVISNTKKKKTGCETISTQCPS